MKSSVRKRLNLLKIVTLRAFVRNYYAENVFGYRKAQFGELNMKRQTLQKADAVEQNVKQCNFYRFLTAYRQWAHRFANINPIAIDVKRDDDFNLKPKTYGLEMNDLVEFQNELLYKNGKNQGTVEEIVLHLQKIYKQFISFEFLHLENPVENDWFTNCIEVEALRPISVDIKKNVATHLLQSLVFDNFLANKFPGLKRYGAEGAESMMAFFIELLSLSAKDSLEELIIAMPHRGRLNLLTGLFNVQPAKIFAKLLGNSEHPEAYKTTGDVLSHFDCSTTIEIVRNSTIQVTVLCNSSHLEAINPVSMGVTRAKQLLRNEGAYGKMSDNNWWSDKTLNIQVHGDASITGQGVNQECLALSQVPHFDIGGTIHLIVNNQLGFTTPSDRGRSSRYCSDIAKLISAPVIHVNGDYPEEVVRATRIAFQYQRKFRKDVFIDLNCYRKWGHNELDDPTFTNPKIYKIINSKNTVPDDYVEKLIADQVLTEDQKDTIITEYNEWLTRNLQIATTYKPSDTIFVGNWKHYSQAEYQVTTWDTGVDLNALAYISRQSVNYPEDFSIHPLLLKNHTQSRLSTYNTSKETTINWSAAETMAFGSLLYDGYHVRISGQDVGRGTFSHRHVMLVDQITNCMHIPLNQLFAEQTAFLEVANSILSEEAVLGFEYGMSTVSPQCLVIWEAQFGDFFNGAQIMFDTFISSAEAKWLWQSGIVILLPHGYDGAGPEHSSARIERFLQLTDSSEQCIDGDNVNMHVCQPSTPSQYFHLLRRQMIRNFRKPLIIIAPKTLLRLSTAKSAYSEFAPGTYFKTVLGSDEAITENVDKILITAGKHYYSLEEKRRSLGASNVVIIRLESFCPFPAMEINQEISKFPKAKEILWCQEEPQNMGAWSFVKVRFENLLGIKIRYCGRPVQAAPAVGIGKLHEQQVKSILKCPF